MINDRLGKYLCSNNISVVEAMQKIDENARGILFVADPEGRLIGSLTDGDIRRWILATGKLSAAVSEMMNPTPKYLCEGDKENAVSYIRKEAIRALPILNANGIITEIVFDLDMLPNAVKSKKDVLAGIPVVIMAGGKGTRLYPYTKILPKPLIPIGDIPIVERIINRFSEYGASVFYLTVHYKKGMIKSYFSELNLDCDIIFVEEDKPLGTAGSIKLIQQVFSTPIIITNCDILIDADYEKILNYHKASGNALTIVAAMKNIVLPYGVLHSREEGIITSIEEKPRLSYIINTGMYLISPEFLQRIPDDSFFHMTDLANLLMNEGQKVGMYPVSENSFLDMGELEEMHRMQEKLDQKSE